LVFSFPFFRHEVEHFFLIVEFTYVLSVVNIGAAALVTEAATAIFGEAGVITATGVMTVCLIFPA
jgi:Mg2+/Co2+ transporter CorB